MYNIQSKLFIRVKLANVRIYIRIGNLITVEIRASFCVTISTYFTYLHIYVYYKKSLERYIQIDKPIAYYNNFEQNAGIKIARKIAIINRIYRN